ncbi:MAG: His/Gly/Thr/Pro-type tRNA ligase C-terminal domain-containing protein, partial [Nanoarchaeota archaeon]
VLHRDWQMGTIQLDFQQPKRFKLYYNAADGTRKTPVVIHRVIYGSMERFIGILIEHFAGKFPLWLSPVQVVVMTMNDTCVPFAREVMEQMKERGIRVELDDRHETIQKKVRDAQLQHIPLMITIGEKEVEKKALAVRTADGKVQFGVKTDSFIDGIVKDIRERKL